MRNPARESPVYSVFEALRPELLRFAYWLCRNRAVAEDVVQEALLRAWRHERELKDREAVRPWLLTIVRREHARLYERKQLEIMPLDEIVEREDDRLSAGDEGDALELRVAILKLPAKYREPLVMQVLGGFTTEEIARELGLTQTAVLTRLFRARNALRVAYGLTAAADVSAQDEDETT